EAEKSKPKPAQQAQIEGVASQLKAGNRQVIVEGYADARDGDKYAASLERANRTREQLIRNGVDPSRVVAVGNGEQAGRAGGVRIVEAPPPQQDAKGSKVNESTATQKEPSGTDPIGSSHFESKSRMSVQRGTSAMVSILNTDTDGEV